VKALDAFIECVLQTLIFTLGGHSSPALDKELEAGYNTPHSGRAFTREALLGIGRLLAKVSKVANMLKQTYPQRVPDQQKALPISLSQVEVCVAAFLRETWHSLTGISEQDKLYDGLSRSEITA
jgi:hypothetical protein